MTTLAFILKVLNVHIQFLTGSVRVSCKDGERTLKDDKYYTKWQIVESHFCRVYEQLKKIDWCDYIPVSAFNDVARAADDQLDIFQVIKTFGELVEEAVETTKRAIDKPLQEMTIDEFFDKDENIESLNGYDRLAFPDAKSAKKYFFTSSKNLPENATWKDEDAGIALTVDPYADVPAMVEFIEKILEGKETWRNFGDIAKHQAAPAPSVPVVFATASQEPDQHQQAVGFSTYSAGLEEGEYSIEQAVKDLTERWDEDINAKPYKAFLRAGLVTSDHMGSQLAKTVWKAAPESATVEQFIRVTEAAIKTSEHKFKTKEQSRLGFRGAVTIILARKAQLDLTGDILTKK